LFHRGRAAVVVDCDALLKVSHGAAYTINDFPLENAPEAWNRLQSARATGSTLLIPRYDYREGLWQDGAFELNLQKDPIVVLDGNAGLCMATAAGASALVISVQTPEDEVESRRTKFTSQHSVSREQGELLVSVQRALIEAENCSCPVGPVYHISGGQAGDHESDAVTDVFPGRGN
jgi:hypothetical protein